MTRANLNGPTVSVDRSFGLEKIGYDGPWVPPISHEILLDLGMSDDAIVQYFCRFRHGRSEQLVRMVLHN
jgi:hypothetical protein